MDKQRLYRLGLGDIVLVMALLAAPAVALLSMLRHGHEPAVAVVYAGGKPVAEHQLARDTVLVVAGAKTMMRVEFKGGRVHVLESNCPNHVCARAGWRNRPGQSIVCVPNRVVIELIGQGTRDGGPEREDCDAETY